MARPPPANQPTALCAPRTSQRRPAPCRATPPAEATPRNGPRRPRPRDSPRPVAHASAASRSPLPGRSRLPRSVVASQVARRQRGACACAPRLLPGWPPTSAAEVGAGGRGRGGARLGRVPPPGATRRDPGGLGWKARSRRHLGGRLAGERVRGGAAAPRGPGLGTPGCRTRTAVGRWQSGAPRKLGGEGLGLRGELGRRAAEPQDGEASANGVQPWGLLQLFWFQRPISVDQTHTPDRPGWVPDFQRDFRAPNHVRLRPFRRGSRRVERVSTKRRVRRALLPCFCQPAFDSLAPQRIPLTTAPHSPQTKKGF